ncbi:zinc-dependent alcohol dehydrogenase family protein [Elizabethkingia anophelis]|uniref:NADPH:quinone oxidoreductase n=1 Tax=Elizabethkingia anophelis TaxID=1117645 RepID=A0A494J8T6_9FLAO|nr:zinc-dependent alcohol dehydrogenase family protein [Elizabethkingia anophelis]AQX51284.1 NADPH:quinone oxidoreductase [Elizabethkingia anophelis]MCT4196735.1 zinc-dependent alcohol dehydrogenase family protein [Elizabethkingia anophelis]MCT4225321.1 zinc-dependent alcohol dehydrogenase family protein [Elizabethkingia anophelis]MCT4306912.1 zinc-dependent alcohol dehydrogenase family protein [Elizabethkingia anophelis]MDV2472672.1 NADPH:quinone oxidoreductase [Elizabethkingia anophelis]
MKAAILEEFGPVTNFIVKEVPITKPKFKEVLVKVFATSINPLDYQIRRGDYKNELSLPVITGHDISGIIVELGQGIENFKVGDEVYYSPEIFNGQGSYAQYHCAHESIIALKPKNISHLQAATLPLAAGTAWEMLVTRAQLKINQTILIHGGAGGVGIPTIQIAKAMGATVFTTAREVHHDFLRELGADYVIDYTRENYIDRINQLTNNKGVDVIIDTIGGTTLTDSGKVLSQLGQVVTLVDIAQPQNLIEAWGKNATYHFVFTRQNRNKLDELTKLIEQGKLKPIVTKVFSLEDMDKAHDLLETKSSNKDFYGKIAIDIEH